LFQQSSQLFIVLVAMVFWLQQSQNSPKFAMGALSPDGKSISLLDGEE
jgi:hypothetical protein